MNIFLKITLGLSTAAVFATTAHAEEMKPAEMTKTVVATQTVKTIDADNQVSQLTLVRMSEDSQAVLGAFEQQNTDAYIVQNNNGDLYINHLVPIEDLPDPALTVDVVDTYEITYRGVTYTNKVIGEQ
ncbi:hypothetical protein GCM10009069_19570 [Algimonas arctica]|uniref:Uncharacterized protein n=1 Tax=Algimonas arctica TaxID=1479486 RepID=A0A8J3CSN4_9PROT|nr:hypothetical protein [Algimonas arctica]GHA96622.1 hypothetical protein GCM10009069_19570 [Algimonas arctica]